jgi:hypothetical protein
MKKVILAGALGIAALAGTNLPGLEATTASAAVASEIQPIEEHAFNHQVNGYVTGEIKEIGKSYVIVPYINE